MWVITWIKNDHRGYAAGIKPAWLWLPAVWIKYLNIYWTTTQIIADTDIHMRVRWFVYAYIQESRQQTNQSKIK